MKRFFRTIRQRGSAGSAAVRGRLRRLRAIKPTRRHMRAALMATVPTAALFGFAGMEAMAPNPAAAAVLSAPLPASVALPDPLPDRAPEAPAAAVEASYYGKGFAGKPTASGETFNPEAMTAAHRTLPFGSIVKVTNAATGKSVEVKINDRGPFHGNREIDLSTAAARELGMLASGTAKVTLDVVGRS